MKKKKGIIKNPFRFILTLFILIIIFVSSTGTFMKVSSAESMEKEKNYFEMYIKPGDTLWDLAKKYTKEGKDIRKTLYEISLLNNLKTSDIYPGQIIKIPLY
ncbi:MAG: LysM peptidoglycan-binding domain-containing protein [Thermotaleaceae bacterium]